jgi:hypothetical protein
MPTLRKSVCGNRQCRRYVNPYAVTHSADVTEIRRSRLAGEWVDDSTPQRLDGRVRQQAGSYRYPVTNSPTLRQSVGGDPQCRRYVDPKAVTHSADVTPIRTR